MSGLPKPTQTHVHRVSDAIQPSHPLSPPSPPTFNLSQHQGLFQGVSSSHYGQSIRVSASTSVLPVNTQDSSPLGELVGSPCSPRDSQESSPTPQFESINSLALSFLYSPILTSIHDYWKNHSFDQTELCWQSNVSAFLIYCLVSHNFPYKEQVFFNFMASVTICSDFRAQKNKVCHCFHCFTIYLP